MIICPFARNVGGSWELNPSFIPGILPSASKHQRCKLSKLQQKIQDTSGGFCSPVLAKVFYAWYLYQIHAEDQMQHFIGSLQQSVTTENQSYGHFALHVFFLMIDQLQQWQYSFKGLTPVGYCLSKITAKMG